LIVTGSARLALRRPLRSVTNPLLPPRHNDAGLLTFLVSGSRGVTVHQFMRIVTRYTIRQWSRRGGPGVAASWIEGRPRRPLVSWCQRQLAAYFKIWGHWHYFRGLPGHPL